MRFKWIALACIVTSASIAIGAGCGLDDTAITPIDSAGTDASFLDGASDTSTDAPDDGGPICEPKSCNNYPSDCHSSLDDGCGQTIDCSGACPGGQACVPDAGAGVDAGFFCNGPPVCRDAGAPGGNCDTLTNPGNGLTTNCGACTGGFACATNTCQCGGTTCGGAICCTGGTPNCNDANNACCKRKTCATDYAGFCNSASDDGCGTANLNCAGNCSGGKVCDTGNNTCCTVTTTCGNNCNTTLTTNCGTSLPCGGCSNGNTCDGSHMCTCVSGVTCGTTCCASASDVCHPSNTCCAPEAMSVTCNGSGAGSYCGNPVPNNCAQNVDCGSCATGQVCKSPGGCPCKNATCNLGQTCDTGGPGSCSG